MECPVPGFNLALLQLLQSLGGEAAEGRSLCVSSTSAAFQGNKQMNNKKKTSRVPKDMARFLRLPGRTFLVSMVVPKLILPQGSGGVMSLCLPVDRVPG